MAKDDEVAYEPGQVLAGKYKVERVLGVGGFGAVLAATHVQLEERVAIKVLLPSAAKNPTAAERFVREAKAAVKIRSEHVARVSDVGSLPDGVPYMVMEYLDGQDLSQVVKARGGQRPDDVAEWVIQACEAIAEAHSLGIIHRDLKPANLFLTRKVDGTPCVKVLDFGISKLTNETGDKGMTKTSDVMGSPFYMSPEQMRSTRGVDARADIWALGAILFELTAGAPPFDAETMTALVVSIMQEPPRELTHYRSDIHPGLRAVILRCLEKDPARRFQDVMSLAEALMPFAPSRAQGSMSRLMAISGRTSQPLAGVVAGSIPPGATVPGAPLAGAQAPAPTQLGGDTMASLPPSSEAMRPSSGLMGATAGAQSWSGTLASTEKPASKLPVLVGVGALAVAALGVGGFLILRAPAETPRSGSVVLDATAGASPAAAPPPASQSPTVAPADAVALGSAGANAASTSRPVVGLGPGKPGATSTASVAPSATAAPVASATATAPTATTKPTATAPPTTTATTKAPPNDVWNSPD